MKKKILIILGSSVFFIAGCQQPNETGAASPVAMGGETIVTVNGKPITEETLTLINSANRGAAIPRDRLLDDLIKQELLYQEAVRKNLKNNPDVAKRLLLVNKSILSQAAMQDFLDTSPVTDEAIKAAYDKQVGGMNALEYKASHILSKTEDEAKKIIQELEQGGDFAELAKKHSVGPSGPKGGDLGWFSADQMVPKFSQAVVALENGATTKEPVKTQFGWHIIYRQDSRSKQPPPLDTVKSKIQAGLQKESIEKYLDSLKNAATIVMVEKEKTSEPAAPAKEAPTADSASAKPAEQPAETEAAPTPSAPVENQ